MIKPYYGAAYYLEYMPEDRLDRDIDMMRAAGITVVRIGESTWSTWEPRDGVFDFTLLDRMLDGMEAAGIAVIVGTPTYAFPSWLARKHPEVLAETHAGHERYGRRQNMDIASPVFRFYAERVIRRMMERVRGRGGVIGFQLDNETKHYDSAGPEIQRQFVEHLRQRFGTPEAVNREFGLRYWSNSFEQWEDFPDVRGTINGSLGAEFERFRRQIVTDYLAWQAAIVREYARDDQFITHNFDYEWRGYSFGVQPDVDHYAAAKSLDIAGCDIYHPTQDDLTGTEISFGGDVCRSLRHAPYFVLETEAQGFPQWTPYPGQLRLQAFSHLASGARMVEYWHWHSIHNSFETYWKGLLSHDFGENPTYLEAKTIGADFARLGERAVLQKKNRAAVLVSNEALTALKWFPIGDGVAYNDVVRWCYDALYRMNVGTDILFPASEDFGQYDLIVVPALYAAPDEVLARLRDFVRDGGTLVVTFKSGFANECVRVNDDRQPHILSDCLGVSYSQFTIPHDVWVEGGDIPRTGARAWMDLLEPQGAQVLAKYDHPAWGRYAAVTEHRYGRGRAYAIGAMLGDGGIEAVLSRALREAGLWGEAQSLRFPVIVKGGVNFAGRRAVYYLNYSGESSEARCLYGSGTELLGGRPLAAGEPFELAPWGVALVEL